MDLETLQSQMKVVIQKHQIVVTEMRKDPQNSVLQKQLSDLNSEIISLSEKQKQIVQQLRNNLQKKQQTPTVSAVTTPVSIQPLLQNTVQTQEVMVCSTPKPMINHRLATPIHTVTLNSKQVPNFLTNSLHQPASVGNLVTSTTGTLTLKGPMGTVVLPNCSTTTALIAGKSSEPKLQPVLVVPTPTNRVVDGPQTGVVLNIVPPIRVPQYPPSVRSSTSLKTPITLTSHITNFATATISRVPSPKIPSPVTESKVISSHHLPSIPSTSPSAAVAATAAAIPSCSNASSSKMNHHFEKPIIKIDPEKRDFMVALGLVAKETLHDMKNKKVERKRRSTANPQFSNAALEEKWRNAAAAAQALGPPMKRPRGRPRLESKVSAAVTNGVGPTTSTADLPECSRNGSSSSKPIPAAAGSAFSASCSSSPTSPISSVPNGIHRRIGPAEDKKVEKLLSNLCIVCTQPGDLVKCDSCAKQQHLGCMQPPLLVKPEVPWQCSECQSRADPLVVVQSYDALKAAKADEKKKLLKKSLELRLKRSQLEGKLFQLKDIATKQKDRQSELQLTMKKTEGSINLLQSVVTCIRQYS